MEDNSPLTKLIEEYRGILLAKNHLDKLLIRLDVNKQKLANLEAILQKEYDDLEQLEQLTISGLFHTILGTREEQYDIEKQEYLHAVLQYQEFKKMVELQSYEQQVLEQKLSREAHIQQQLNHFLMQRNQLIDEKYAGLRDQLRQIFHQHDQKINYKRELYEALIVALKADKLLDTMINNLIGAKATIHWGYDLVENEQTKAGKNKLIDKTQEISYQVKQLLQELEDEMEDIYNFKSVKRLHKIESFQQFNNLYYDRMLSDWVVHKKILSTIDHLKGTRDSVKLIIHTLKAQQKMTEHSIDYLIKRREELIIEHVKLNKDK